MPFRWDLHLDLSTNYPVLLVLNLELILARQVPFSHSSLHSFPLITHYARLTGPVFVIVCEKLDALITEISSGRYIGNALEEGYLEKGIGLSLLLII